MEGRVISDIPGTASRTAPASEGNSPPFAAAEPRLHLTKSGVKGSRMSDTTVAAGRRSRWGLFIAPVLLLILAVAWSGFWFYAASQAEVAADAWRAQEAKSGRIYDCAKRSIAGFPF